MIPDPDERGAAPGHDKPREVEIHNGEAERLIRGGEYEAARRLLEPASGTAPGAARTVYNMAVLDDGAGMSYEGADGLDRLVESGRKGGDASGDPGLGERLVVRGLVHAHEGSHESAIECYDRTARVCIPLFAAAAPGGIPGRPRSQHIKCLPQTKKPS